MSATKPTKKTAPKVRAPEEVVYDLYKHPEGVPGGMGRSPEHHLRGRGWTGHKINEGSGKKTILYRNAKHPDFVVSYGGGTPQKPDHNFRVLYMGDNTNIPKVTQAYSPAEAMNKVEELHQLHSGLVVQPMTHGASAGPLGYNHAVEGAEGLTCPNCGSGDLYHRTFRARQEEPDLGCNGCREKMHSPEGHVAVSDGGWELGDDAFGMAYGAATRTPALAQEPNVPRQKTPAPPSLQDMTVGDEHPIGPPKVEFPTAPDRESDWPKKQKPQLKEIPDLPRPVKHADSKDTKGIGVDRLMRGPARTQNEHGTLAAKNRHRVNGEDLCPLCRKASQVYRRDPSLYRDLVKDSGGLTEDHLRTTSPFHDRVSEALIPRVGKPPRHPDGQGPADLGRPEYQRVHRRNKKMKDDTDVAQIAVQRGMDISPEEVSSYRGLRGLSAVLRLAQRDTWEEA